MAAYSSPPPPRRVRERVAKGLLYLGVALGDRGRPAGAPAAYQQLIDRNGEIRALELREQLAKALDNKGVVLAEPGRSQDAVAGRSGRFDQGTSVANAIAHAVIRKWFGVRGQLPTLPFDAWVQGAGTGRLVRAGWLYPTVNVSVTILPAVGSGR